MRNQQLTLDMDTAKKKRVNVTLEEQLHREMSAAAALAGVTKPEYIAAAIREKLERDRQEGQG